MRANYAESLQAVLVHEGGFVNNPKDPGGMTNLGCTKATLGLHLSCTRATPGLRPGYTRVTPGLHPGYNWVTPWLHPVALGLHPGYSRL